MLISAHKVLAAFIVSPLSATPLQSSSSALLDVNVTYTSLLHVPGTDLRPEEVLLQPVAASCTSDSCPVALIQYCATIVPLCESTTRTKATQLAGGAAKIAHWSKVRNPERKSARRQLPKRPIII